MAKQAFRCVLVDTKFRSLNGELNPILCVSQELPDWRLLAPPEKEDARPNTLRFGLLPFFLKRELFPTTWLQNGCGISTTLVSLTERDTHLAKLGPTV